MQGGCN